MDTLSGWLKGSVPDNEPAAAPSVLSEWRQYSGTSAPASNSQADRLLASAEEGASTVGKSLSNALSTLTSAASGAAASATSGLQR